MAEDSDEQTVGVPRVDDDLRDLLAVSQAQVGPGLPGVGGLVDAVARGQIRPLQSLAAPDVDDVRVRRREGDGADRPARLVVEDREPGAPVVGRLPDAAVDDADVEDVGLARDAGGGFGAAPAKGPDVAPVHLVEKLRRETLRERPAEVARERDEAGRGHDRGQEAAERCHRSPPKVGEARGTRAECTGTVRSSQSPAVDGVDGVDGPEA